MCSRILLDDLGHPHGLRWQFIDRERAAMSLVAYRDGRAPWQLDRPAAADPVYTLNEVTERPRLRRCPVTPRVAAGQPVPDPVTVELIVEPDSTASQIRVVDAPTATVRQLVERAIRSCSFAPGLLQGTPVRVRVRFPVPVGGSS